MKYNVIKENVNYVLACKASIFTLTILSPVPLSYSFSSYLFLGSEELRKKVSVPYFLTTKKVGSPQSLLGSLSSANQQPMPTNITLLRGPLNQCIPISAGHLAASSTHNRAFMHVLLHLLENKPH